MQTLDKGWILARDPANVGRRARWFETGPTADARPAPVPGIIQQVFPEYHGVAWYWRRFEPLALPSVATRQRWQIHFQGFVDYLAEVWLNSQYLGSYEGGEGPFDLDATDALRPGQENLLAVRVLNPTNEPIDGYVLKETPHRNKVMPYIPGSGFNYGGIMLPVEVRTIPVVRVNDVYVRPDPHTGDAPVGITLRNETGQAASGRIRVAIGPANAQGPATQVTAERDLTLPPGATTTEVVLHLHQPRLWNLDDPYLYRVSLRLEAVSASGITAADEYSVRCGFRELRVENGFFRLNGKRLFLRSTHTGNHVPFGQAAPVISDLMRRDAIMAKAAGFNCVRFICGVAWPEQLDFFDEIGLLAYEECMASWRLADSPKMAARFDHNTAAMILRDRNHPSVGIWGLLNETFDGPVARHARAYLPRLRELDPTRLVLLSSGRWDCQWDTGSLSNPGSRTWEHAWGNENPGAAPAVNRGVWSPDLPGGYFEGAGDAHLYPRTPQTPSTNRFLRTIGQGTRPVFVSEYGIGSLFNVIRETRCFEQAGVRADLFDVTTLRRWAERIEADWQRLGFDGVYAVAEDMLRDSQRLHTRQRLLGFDLIRSNPQICGFNVTGMLDHGMTGEGLWTFNREWKPGIADALSDGWAPVRWCLFVEPSHGYVGRPFRIEAVLANEDVLPPGTYPALFRIMGPQGVAWEKRVEVSLPEPAAGRDAPLAAPVLGEDVVLPGPAGAYELRAYLQQGGAPAGGRLTFYLSEAANSLDAPARINAWGIDQTVLTWLRAHGIEARPFGASAPNGREVILVGNPPVDESDLAHWSALARRLAGGSAVVFLVPAAFQRGDDPVGWLPLAEKGRRYEFHDWLYHKECVAKRHPAFAGLQAGGIMDWEYYGPVIPHHLYDGQPAPDEVIAAAFAVSVTNREGYASGVLLGSYGFGAGRFMLNTIPILENLDRHPAADRLLLNLVRLASGWRAEPVAAQRPGFEELAGPIKYVA